MKTLITILLTSLSLFAAQPYLGGRRVVLEMNGTSTNQSVVSPTITDAVSISSTGGVTAASLTLPGPDPGTIAFNSGATISNGGGDFALTNDLPVRFASNVVFTTTITDSSGSVGTTNYVLSSGGTGQGTLWKIASASPFTIAGGSGSTTVADSTTYYSGFNFSAAMTTSQGRYGIPVLHAGTIKAYYVSVFGTGGSAENVTIDIWVSNSTSVGSHTETWDSFPIRTTTSGLSTAVTTSDYIELRVTNPAWVTNPTGVSIGFGVLIEY